ncbi:phosphoesterase, putative [Trichoderma parareesei]|uniref:Phosphoesterase, putative n=1 Tax=Trichoderma parareesei TaxID=858221 RepID=A0A2H2ZMU0_TRIPA|nr:phosphoesterase, putative [Trichoderma parareesei]
MTRRIVRTLTQLGAVVFVTTIVIFFLDRNYRVLPNALHNYMPSHHPGLVVTDITLTTCSTLKPFSSCELNPNEWQRIEKELYLGRAWTSKAYLHVRRKREEELSEDDKVVVGVSVGSLNPGDVADGSEHWEPRPGGIWLKRSRNKKSSDSDAAVTDVDVVFGDDATEARNGWGIVGRPLHLGTGGNLLSAHLTVRRGAPHQPKKPKPRIPDNGRFKIMQVGDLHLSTGVGECRDAVPDSYKGGKCEADPRTLDFLTKMLDEEKPDLVILSGDQVNGDTAPDAPSAIYKYASLLIERKIPYAAIFGNHDDEKSMSREGQMALMETLPYSLSQAGPVDVDGVGNYYIEVLARGHNEHSALTIYLLDTHAYSPDERHYPGYDWVKPSQIDWFKRTSASLKKNHDGYTHRHMDIAFIHIPLTEYADWDKPRVGEWREGVTAPVYNTGFHDALIEEGVVMVSAGHDHVNDYCSLSSHGDETKSFLPGWDQKLPLESEKDKDKDAAANKVPAMWMCYSGGIGFGGYAGYDGYIRRLRLFEVDTEEARITTWKRVEFGDNAQARVDQQILVEAGKAYFAPPPPPSPPPPAEAGEQQQQQQQQ